MAIIRPGWLGINNTFNYKTLCVFKGRSLGVLFIFIFNNLLHFLFFFT